MFRPCFVIPCHNHGSTMPALLAALAPHALRCYVIDDGSGPETAAQLDALAAGRPHLTLLRNARNAGKGAASILAMHEAWKSGYTHALQIDADGQHDTGDVSRLLAESEAHPQSLISGRAVFDASAPAARRHGRKITHALVWLETLSLAIEDSFCGFRVYPLAETIGMLQNEPCGQRMDFDTDIIVRLFRNGVGVRFMPTRVRYPPGGLSNFDLLRDNLRMARLHLRLLATLPLYLPRRLTQGLLRQRHWTRLAERGTVGGIRFMFWVYRVLGRHIAHLLLYAVVAYFWLTAFRARRASQEYLVRVRATAERKGVTLPPGLNTYRHLLRFGTVILQRLASWAGLLNLDAIMLPNLDLHRQIARSGRGVLVIASHLGDLEPCRAYADREGEATVNAIVFSAHAQKFERVIRAINPGYGLRLMQVPDLGPETAIRLRDKISAGEWVVIVGDRMPVQGPARVSWAEFLGSPAPFPQGPFILAALLECPVYLMFGIEEPSGLQLYLEHFADPVKLPRQERDAVLTQTVQRYAQRLEFYCLRAPLDWFNFFDFWHAETEAPRPDAE